jgi:hypothetical protein
MKDDYKLAGPSTKLSTDIEKGIFDTIVAMADYTGISISELTNTALKRFVSGHKDFLPPHVPKSSAPARKVS